MRNPKDRSQLWNWLLGGLVVLALAACSSARYSGERTNPQSTKYTIIATGRTTMHVADWVCVNDTREPMLFRLEPGILYGPEEYQPLIFTEPVSVTVPPKTTATFPIDKALCIDISRLAPPEGTALTYIGPDDFGPSNPPGTDFGNLPGYTPTEGFPSMSIVPKVPGYEFPFTYTIDIKYHLAEAAPILMAAAVSLNESYDEMEAAGEIDTPLPPEMEEESVKQQTYWMVTSGLMGNEYKKTDLEMNMKKDYQNKTGQTIEATSSAMQTDFYEGVDILWDRTCVPLAKRARLINPAWKWEGVDQMVWIDVGPGGGSYTLPDGTASLTFSPYLDQPISGTFFSRTYDVPGLRSFGFYPSETLNDVPAPKLSLLLIDQDISVSRRIGDDPTFYPIPKPRPGVGISLPVAESEILLSKPDDACVIPPEALVPPLPPVGYEYAGQDVVINHVYKEQLSTLPAERPHSSNDHIVVRNSTEVGDGVTVCNWIVVHTFQPAGTKVVRCPIPEDMLEPPADPPEPGMKYVGRTVVEGHSVRADLTTEPLVRPHKKDDVEVIRYRIFPYEGVTCEVIVSFVYEKSDD